ncbi:MAG: cbb3-type cytochrome c oxidase subunit I [Gammaproteobacteria bacterium]|nr:cbb3-type cytochrome c oxidase subunit I [Gammaproteobacteria bacterium]
MTEQYTYTIEIPTGEPRRLAVGWLVLAVSTLVVGGILAVLIVLSRTPGVQNIIPWTDFFHTAIVVHVDLTVMVWFIAFAGVLWSLNSAARNIVWGWLALYVAVTGTIIFTVSPFIGAGNPLMNNYIPVLQDSKFLTGLAVFGLGFILLISRSLFSLRPTMNLPAGEVAMRFGLLTALLAAMFAMLALAATYVFIPEASTGRAFYELLFWGGGHVVQFTYTQLMLVGWLWLASVSGVALCISPRVVLWVLALGFAPVLYVPVIYILYDVNSAEHIVAFTQLMIYGGGLAALPLGLVIVYALFVAGRAPDGCAPQRAALIYSIILFAAGGVIGYLISGTNVTIPAHYHGSIVAVTLAFMGVTYHLLPRLGFRNPSLRLARWQPAIFGGGQLLHVMGLAWSGGYGVQRKTAGAAQGLDSIPEIAGMILMGVGGIISIIGGVLFFFIAIKALWPVKSISASPAIK